MDGGFLAPVNIPKYGFPVLGRVVQNFLHGGARFSPFAVTKDI